MGVAAVTGAAGSIGDFAAWGLGWWYVGPRDGHISIFSRKSLIAAWRRFGFTLGSFNDNFHVAFRKLPNFAKHLSWGDLAILV